MGKALFAVVLLALVGTARCYNADLAGGLSGLPVVGGIVSPQPAAPAYVAAMGTPAALNLPEADLTQVFPLEFDEPYDEAKAKARAAFFDSYLPAARTAAGFAEVCKRASSAVGADRSANTELGALACSADPSVTRLQRFALRILEAEAETYAWAKGQPGASTGAIASRQGEIRVLCETDITAREGATGPLADACSAALDTAYLAGDAKATHDSLAKAYGFVATEIARRDPKTAPEPASFDPVTQP